MAKNLKLFLEVGGFIVLFFTALAQMGIFQNAEIVQMRKVGTDYVCPSNLFSSFDLTFSNTGSKNADLCVEISSPNNINITKSKDCLYAVQGGEIPFSFRIDESSLKNSENISIFYLFSYKKWFSTINRTFVCKYQHEQYGYHINLVSEKEVN